MTVKFTDLLITNRFRMMIDYCVKRKTWGRGERAPDRVYIYI